MKKWGLLSLVLAFGFLSLEAQVTRYLVTFKDKGTSPYAIANPSAYLSQRSIERRTRYSIAIDSTDLPVTPRYIDSLRSVSGVTVLNVSRWLNQASIQTSDPVAISKINNFSFVKTVAPLATRAKENDTEGTSTKFNQKENTSRTSRASEITANYYNYGQSDAQIRIHNGEFLHNIGLRGQNIVIGVLDAGFFNFSNLRSFDSINRNGQILGTWDFVAGDASVVEDNAHGMQCLSILAANIPGVFIGTAPKSCYYLFRSEDASSEYPVEEFNWVCAAERVDSAGGDLISSSLGYNTFDPPLNQYDYTYAQMNGNVTRAAIGADLAAKKGILVVNAAGNEGNNSWRYIITPADGDSVLAVGAVATNGTVGSFSSYGYSADGQVKPDVASVGVATTLQLTDNNIGTGNGTSFACPNMAGLIACLWQGFPEFNNMKIIKALRQSGSIYNAPNNRIGYGIPNVKTALVNLLKDFSTASATVTGCKATISWTSKDIDAMKYDIERKAPGETSYTKIAERPGSGNIFSAKSYQLVDSLANVQSGTISYRIRQIVDTNSIGFTADYIDTVNVNSTTSCITTAINPVNGNLSEIRIIPNPAYKEFILRISGPTSIQKLRIEIVNAVGQIVSITNEKKLPGTFNITVPVSHLAKGRYIVSVYDNLKLVATEELIKL